MGTLSDSLKLQSTDTLLIRGGTTSVGLACAALAKSSLFAPDTKPTVIATTRSEAKAPALKAAGVDVVLIDKDNSIAKQVMRRPQARARINASSSSAGRPLWIRVSL